MKKCYSLSYIICITLIATIGGLLFGYDTAVISGAEKGLEIFFCKAMDFHYGNFLHGVTSSSALIGCVLGAIISGIFAYKYGRRNSLRFASVLFFLSALGSCYPEFLFFSGDGPSILLLILFNLYRILGGIGVGLASALVPMYIAEIAPSQIRGVLVSCNQFAIIAGMLMVYFVNYLILGGDYISKLDLWPAIFGWRYMFGSGIIMSAIFAFLLFCVPETPRYLILCGRVSKAFSVLGEINEIKKAKEILLDIQNTSKEKTEKLFSYGISVVIIGIFLSIFQQAIGINAVLYYAPRIFTKAGVGGGSGMMQTLIMGIVNVIFTLVAICSVDKFGRKPLLIIGSVGMAIGSFGVAISDHFMLHGYVSVISIIIYAAFFMMSWGPVCWVLISEIFPNTIRGKSVAIAVTFQWIFNFIVSFTFPSLYNFSPMVSYGMYSLICILASVFVFKWVPETKGKTLEEMSKFWKK